MKMLFVAPLVPLLKTFDNFFSEFRIVCSDASGSILLQLGFFIQQTFQISHWWDSNRAKDGLSVSYYTHNKVTKHIEVKVLAQAILNKYGKKNHIHFSCCFYYILRVILQTTKSIAGICETSTDIFRLF